MLEENKPSSSLEILLSVVLIGLGLFLGFILQPSFENPVESNLAVPIVIGELVGEPIHIRIPKIDVDAVVEHVGLTPLGLMDSPKDPDEVGWFKLGTRPGESGSAVIDGHSGWKNDIPAVFDDLDKLKKGDKIYVEDESGISTTFVVREIRVYNPDADAEEVFSSSDDLAHLNLITCTGIWDNVKKSSSERLVVFTDKE